MKIVNCEQRTTSWYDVRRGMPTCSRFDGILTPKTGKPSAAQETLINELISEALLPPEQGVIRRATPEMEQGMILEAEARGAFEAEFAADPVLVCGFIIHDSGAFGGSPDALIGDESGLEIKCPQGSTHIGYIRAGKLPAEYRCQVHGYMIVTGRNQWDFFSYCRNLPPLHVRVKRDTFTATLERELLAFIEKLNTARAAFGLPKLGAK